MSGWRVKIVLSPQGFVVSPTVENSHHSESNQDNIRLAPLTRKAAKGNFATRSAPPALPPRLTPSLQLRPSLLQCAKLRPAHQKHINVLVRHRQRMIHGANFFYALKFLRERLIVVAHHDHAFARVPARTPIVITLMPGKGPRQAHLRAKEIDGSGLPV